MNIAKLTGDALANALMKAETKAKRRATLSLCGLGFLDETEIETIPEKAKRPPPDELDTLNHKSRMELPAARDEKRRPRTIMPAPKARLAEPIDELPDHSAPPKLDTRERDGVPAFLDRRQSAEASYLDLVGGDDAR